MQKTRKLVILSTLLYLTLYISLAFTVYATPWYTWNTPSKSVDLIGAGQVTQAHTNLTQFFLHREALQPTTWNQREILHMSDVRDIYDMLFYIAIGVLAILTVILLRTPKKQRNSLLSAAAKINIFLPLVLLIIIPFFSYFWSNIFHSIFFTNNLWIITPQDISYYLFPLQFFINALLFIAITASFLSYIAFKIASKQSKILI